MGRPPCCDKVGIKKGPWTPEEDIILVSYIQEHGPGNWRSVPTNTGLLRCSKSCRLRWTNYLRPGIKRGNFTPHEEGMIIHLQALLGNKWAAIASYLPQRTDNDIKNYWNTHLKKKLNKLQSSSTTSGHHPAAALSANNNMFSLDMANNSPARLNLAATYASSTENISRLLQGWMSTSSSPKPSVHFHPIKSERQGDGDGDGGFSDDHLISNDDLESILSFDNLNNYHTTTTASDSPASNDVTVLKQTSHDHHHPPLTFLEKWLLDESSAAAGQVEEMSQMMELSSIF